MSRNFDALQKAGPAMADELLARIASDRMIQSRCAPTQSDENTNSELEHQSAVDEIAGISFRTVLLRISTGPLLPFDGTHADAAEQYRSIRTKIGHHTARPRTILLSSAGPGDGKTTTSINLAAAMALKDDTKVLLMDADFRRSSIAEVLGIPDCPGLVEVLSGACPPEEAIIRVEQFPNLHVLPSGGTYSSPAELLDSAAWPALVSRLRACFDFVLVDTPPLASVTDVDLIQAICDGLIFIVSPDRSRMKALRAALEAIPSDKLIGVVLNRVQDWFLWKSPHRYGYYYSPKARP